MSYFVVKGPARKRDREGMRVRSLRRLENAQVAIPAGAIGTITRQHIANRASSVTFDKCERCGVSPIVAGLNPGSEYEFVDAHVVPPEAPTPSPTPASDAESADE